MRRYQFSMCDFTFNATYATIGLLVNLFRRHKENSTDIFITAWFPFPNSIPITESKINYLQLALIIGNNPSTYQRLLVRFTYSFYFQF